MYTTKAYTPFRIVQQMNAAAAPPGPPKSEEERNMDKKIAFLQAALNTAQKENKELSDTIPKLREKLQEIANLEAALEDATTENDSLQEAICDLEREFTAE